MSSLSWENVNINFMKGWSIFSYLVQHFTIFYSEILNTVQLTFFLFKSYFARIKLTMFEFEMVLVQINSFFFRSHQIRPKMPRPKARKQLTP